MALGKRRTWIWIPLAAGLLVVAIVASGKLGGGHNRSAEPTDIAKEPDPVVVTVEPATPRPIRRTISCVGSLWGWDEVPITPKVEGKVLHVHRDVGDVVRPGELLLELDATDFELAVTEARRGLELELAKLGLKELPPGEVDMTRQPSVVRADAIQKLAEVRAGRLRGGGRAVTEEELQQAETDIEVAKANRSQAILEARATLAAARHRHAVLASAIQRLADTKIVVPTPKGTAASGISGEAEYVIGYRRVAEGEFVRIVPLVDVPPLFRLVLDRALRLQVTIPERHKAEVKVGQAVEIEVESYPNRKFAAKVTRVSPAVDRSNRTFMVEIVVPNGDRLLSAGSFTKTRIVTNADDKAVTVPEEAIVSFAGVTKVFVLQGDKVREIIVKVGAAVSVGEGNQKRTWAEVEGNLPASAMVVTSGMSRLADGITVRIRER